MACYVADTMFKSLVGVLQIISAGFIGYSVNSIRKEVNKTDGTD